MTGAGATAGQPAAGSAVAGAGRPHAPAGSPCRAPAARHSLTCASAGKREVLQHARDRRRIEPAQRQRRRLAHLAEQRAAQVDRGGAATQPARSRASRDRSRVTSARAIRSARAGPQRARQRRMIRRSSGGMPVTVQSRRVLAGARGDLIVRLSFAAQEAQDRGQRRQPDRAFAQPGGAQPVLVELEPVRQQIGDRLVQAGDEHPADSRLTHRARPKPLCRARSRRTTRGRSDIVRSDDGTQRRSRPPILAGGTRATVRRRKQEHAARRRRPHHRSSARRARARSPTRSSSSATDPAPFASLGLDGRAGRRCPAAARSAASTPRSSRSPRERTLVVACDMPCLERAAARAAGAAERRPTSWCRASRAATSRCARCTARVRRRRSAGGSSAETLEGGACCRKACGSRRSGRRISRRTIRTVCCS